MRKSVLATILTVALLCGVFPVGYLSVDASTVTGTITSDTTWSLANSPIEFQSDVYVYPGVTLTIEPGVTVNYNGHNFYVNGTLNAIGTENQKINLNAGPKWDYRGPECTTYLYGQSKISYATMSARFTLNGDIQISNCYLEGEIGIYSGMPQIKHNYINGSFGADGVGIYKPNSTSTTSAVISDNEFANCYRAIAVTAGCSSSIVRNYFHDNSWAIVSGCSAFTDMQGSVSMILNNTVRGNTGGIIVIGNMSPTIDGNNIKANNDFGLSLGASSSDQNSSRVWGTRDQDATGNWWGTTNEASISQAIIDKNDNSPVGIVTFKPYLTEPNPQAMPNTALPVPNITSEPTPQPTHTPTPIRRIQSYSHGGILNTEYYTDNSSGQPQNTFSHLNTQSTGVLQQQPQAGNVLIAAIGYTVLANGRVTTNVEGINQQGVTWSRQVSNFTGNYGQMVEIWLGVVGEGASQDFTITYYGSGEIFSYILAYSVCEYQGVATVNPLDQTASNWGFGSQSDTGTTALTSKPDELWVGAVMYYMSMPQTGATNGFQQVGGDPTITGGRLSTALLDKVVSERGYANTGTYDGASPSNWGGCIATFYAADQRSSDSLAAPKLQFTCQSSVQNSIQVTINGNLTANGVGIPDQPVRFSYSVTNGASWTDLTSVVTDGSGCFSVIWNPTVSGNYLVKADYTGDAGYPSASTTVNFAVSPFGSGTFFAINSNSTLSALNFNSEAKQLSFTVSGPTGTTGYVEIYIPKTLMPDVSGLTVNLDQSAVAYQVQDHQDAWLITFSYHHSTHEVGMNLGAVGLDFFFVALVLLAVLVPVALAIGVYSAKRCAARSRFDLPPPPPP